jgi:cupin 2 domain-containing protein
MSAATQWLMAFDPSRVLSRWRSRGFEGGVWHESPGRALEDDVHHADELFMVVEGEVELELESQCYLPVPGEEVLIPAGSRHTVRNRGGSSARWLYAYKQRG